MSELATLDIGFDFRSDTPAGEDADKHSQTLRRYHRLLWSKPLPNGTVFELVASTPGRYLHHRSDLGEFTLSSDTVIPDFRKEPRIAHILEELSAGELEAFVSATFTIGGMMIFPGNRIGRKNTINGARGFHPRIKDRFDLTVECIRRHYLGQESPLSAVLARYADFFGLFGDFRGYVEFFLLQDLVSEEYKEVRFFTPFEDFLPWPIPETLEAYAGYCEHAATFVHARNRRIDQWRQLQNDR